MMQTQTERAKQKLYSAGTLEVDNIKLFPGSSRDVTAEQMAEQINKALAQIEAGDYELVEQLPD